MTPYLRVRVFVFGLAIGTAACSGGGTAPTSPPDFNVKLKGTWTGTLTVTRRNVPAVSGPLTWIFAVDSAAPINGYHVQVASQNPWLPFTSLAVSALDGSSGASSPIYTYGNYHSPRGCDETFSSSGIASDLRIDATFDSADCDHQTFSGTVALTRASR